MPLRKESVRTGSLRLIDVQDYDLSACGGTHVERTGAIGVIAIGGWEKFQGGSRVEFLCGGRALQRVSGVARFAVGDAEAPVGAAHRDGRVDRAHAGRCARRCSGRFAASRKSSRSTRRGAAGERLAGDRRSARGLGRAGAQGDCRRGHRRSTEQRSSCLFTTATPAQVVVARGANATSMPARC